MPTTREGRQLNILPIEWNLIIEDGYVYGKVIINHQTDGEGGEAWGSDRTQTAIIAHYVVPNVKFSIVDLI